MDPSLVMKTTSFCNCCCVEESEEPSESSEESEASEDESDDESDDESEEFHEDEDEEDEESDIDVITKCLCDEVGFNLSPSRLV